MSATAVALRDRPDARTPVVHVLGSATNPTNPELVRNWRAAGVDAALVAPEDAERVVRPGDVVLGRLDVLPTLDGVEPGLVQLRRLERRGVRVLNRAGGLLAVHDKLRTARLLDAAGVPHPRTAVLRPGDARASLDPPLVVKPRFGSWGRDVVLCRDGADLERALPDVRARPWFRGHGALLQELVAPCGYDLRLVVAAGRVVAAAERVAAPGEWRTNTSLGGTLRPPRRLPGLARSLAAAAARAVGVDLVGVDLLPTEAGSWVVLELNAAVDFDERYSLPGGNAYLDAAAALALPAGAAVLP